MQTTDWKQKTIQGSHNKKRKNKRIKEIALSRDGWKAKAMQYKAQLDKINRDLKKTKSWLSVIAP